MTPTPLRDRITSLIAWLADRIAGLGGSAGRDHAGGGHAGLEPAQAGALLARLRHLAARFRAVAATPIPPPKPAPKPAAPKFVPTHRFRDLSADPPPERSGLPRSWLWLLRLVPQAAAARAEMEALLRDPAMQDRLAADRRLGPILRPLGWMLGVERALLPPSRRRPVILVPGGRAAAAAAAAEYAGARAKAAPGTDILALCCLPPAGRRDRRPVWRGCAALAPSDGAEIPA